MNNLLGAFSILGFLASLLVLFLTFTASNGAPQEAVGITFAIALNVIPYCLHGTYVRMERKD